MKIKKLKSCILDDANMIKAMNFFIEKLSSCGIFVWHKASNGKSTYLKFRDVRLGTIRISNHKCLEKYNYTTTFNYEEEGERELNEIVKKIKEKRSQISGFDKQKFIVKRRDGKGFEEVNTLREYRLVTMHPELY